MTPKPDPGLWGWGLALIAPILLGIPALREYQFTAPLQQLDHELQSLGDRLRGRRHASDNPVILAIDEQSLALDSLLTPEERARSPLLQAMGPWPWPRALQAELAAYVLERGARRVIFCVVLSPSGCTTL